MYGNIQTSKRYVKSENRFHAQHLLPRSVNKITDDHVATIYEADQAGIDLSLDSLEGFRREVARWRTRWAITKGNDLPTTLYTILDSVNPVLYPSTDTILCVLLIMPIESATAERSFSVLRRLKTYVRSTMKNDRLSSLGLMHIHRDFEVNLYKAMKVLVSANFEQFQKMLVYRCH